MVIGGFMVDLAQEHIGPGVEADAIVETIHCLPDAVQILTPCTFGNGWMKVVDWDKFALTLYDKKKLEGVRVWLDLEKTRRFPDVYNWYMRLVPKSGSPPRSSPRRHRGGRQGDALLGPCAGHPAPGKTQEGEDRDLFPMW